MNSPEPRFEQIDGKLIELKPKAVQNNKIYSTSCSLPFQLKFLKNRDWEEYFAYGASSCLRCTEAVGAFYSSFFTLESDTDSVNGYCAGASLASMMRGMIRYGM